MDLNDGVAFDQSTNEVFASFPWFNRNLDDPVTVNDPVLRVSLVCYRIVLHYFRLVLMVL